MPFCLWSIYGDCEKVIVVYFIKVQTESRQKMGKKEPKLRHGYSLILTLAFLTLDIFKHILEAKVKLTELHLNHMSYYPFNNCCSYPKTGITTLTLTLNVFLLCTKLNSPSTFSL